jgi:hypothetical protein
MTSVGMIYDRALTPDLLDIGLRVATKEPGSPDARRTLTIALRDHVSPQEAEGKTKKGLTRIWVRPPEAARPMIAWGVAHQHLVPARNVLHFGAMLATFPFVGTVAAIIGRQLRHDGVVEPRQVRRDTCLVLGDRSSVDVGARKVVTTMRYLGLLEAADGKVLTCARPMAVPAGLGPWITHALLLTRQVEAVGIDELSRSPELATLDVANGRPNGYPLLDAHAEGSRTVAVVNSRELTADGP